MKERPPAWLSMVAGVSMLLGLIAGVVLIVAGVAAFSEEATGNSEGYRNVAWGLFVMVFALALYTALQALLTIADNSATDSENGNNSRVLAELLSATREQRDLLRRIHETALLSESAKRIAFRNKDRDAIRAAIREDLDRYDYDAAYALIDMMEHRLGYRAEAQQFREEVEAARQDASEQAMGSEVAEIEQKLRNRDWDGARKLAEDLKARAPGNSRIARLPARIEQAYSDYKKRLIEDFKKAADRGETDHAMSVLRELDKYLTPKEAEAYQDAARGVIKDRLRNLQLSFSLAWNEKDYRTALDIANNIIEEFPTSKMADEVRGRMDELKRGTAGA